MSILDRIAPVGTYRRLVIYGFRNRWFWSRRDWRKLPGFSGLNLIWEGRVLGLGAAFVLLTGQRHVAFELGHAYLLQISASYQQDTREGREPWQSDNFLHGPSAGLTLTILGCMFRLRQDHTGDVLGLIVPGSPLPVIRKRLWAPRLAHV